jgi:hypothetical protein
MNTDQNYAPDASAPTSTDDLPSTIAITQEIREIATRSAGDVIALLHLLRTLEKLHHEIQEGYFQAALPDSRQSLYALLRDIEENGGWPYIQRFKLQALCAHLLQEEEEVS